MKSKFDPQCECEKRGMPLACGRCSMPEWLRDYKGPESEDDDE